MAHIAEGQPTRVRSRDGAEIAFWTSGDPTAVRPTPVNTRRTSPLARSRTSTSSSLGDRSLPM